MPKFIFSVFTVSGAADSRHSTEVTERMEIGENSENEEEAMESGGAGEDETGDLISEDIFNLVPFSKKWEKTILNFSKRNLKKFFLRTGSN